MSRSTLSQVWRWSVMTSPLLNAWKRLRYMGYPNHKSDALLDAVDLPKPIDDLIRDTVKRSKLWCNERVEIAQELIAHAQDAIKAEHSTQDIVNTFGNPKHIAKLMRRSMKRKRPLYWRAYRNMRRATWVMVLLLIVGYGSLAVRFYMGKPSIKRNYIAELNARNDQYTEDQKAWSVYQDVDLEWQRFTLRDWESIENKEYSSPQRKEQAKRSYRSSWLSDVQGLDQDNPKYLVQVELFRSFEPELDRVREAASREIMGISNWMNYDSIEIEPGIWKLKGIDPDERSWGQKTLVSVLLPDLSLSRGHVNRLLFDAQLAVEDQDSERAVLDILAALGIGRQVKRGREFLIGSMVAIAVTEQSASVLQELIAEHPSAFTRDQLIELSHAFVSARDNLRISFKGYVDMFEDILQKAYTDDGNGNGRLTNSGVKMLADFNNQFILSAFLKEPQTIEDYLVSASSPAALLAMNDRVTERRDFLRRIQILERGLADGPESIGRVQYELDLLDTHDEPILESPAELFAMKNTRRVEDQFIGEMRVDSTLTMLAIEIFKIEHGEYPESLTQLVPQYLPKVPADYFDPGQPIQYKLSSNGYLLFSVGSDGNPDGGLEYTGNDYRKSSSLMRRFKIDTVSTDGGQQVQHSSEGVPFIENDGAPDCDWILVDTRSDSDSTNGE